MEQTEEKSLQLQIKKQNSKTQSYIDQLKFNENKDFYKANFSLSSKHF